MVLPALALSCSLPSHFRQSFRLTVIQQTQTPMPSSFANVLKQEDAWDLMHYLHTLQVNNRSPELIPWESTHEGNTNRLWN